MGICVRNIVSFCLPKNSVHIFRDRFYRFIRNVRHNSYFSRTVSLSLKDVGKESKEETFDVLLRIVVLKFQFRYVLLS